MAIRINDLVGTWAASPPILYYQLREKVDDPSSSFQDLADIVSTDPALSARLLKIVNSAFYGFPEKVETLTHALNIVGTDQLTDLALAAIVTSKFEGIPRDLINMETFWMHSIGCGIAARKISEYIGGLEPDKMYLAGMLHDIGSLILFKESSEDARKILQRCRDTGEHLFEVEKELLGFDHAEVGALLLTEWKLPQRLVEIVKNHHQPTQSDEYLEDTCVIARADALVYDLNVGSSGEPGVPELDPVVLEMVHITDQEVSSLKDEVAEMVDGTVRMFI
ncbi:MAG: HDOD domain-containing protein [Nitrospinaceae bacterium]|nr:HDOD domain-containing protein [Nitrospinaceae bacterium]NIR57682.1 HDOD domain-containing protein [Nitrospinaceae bacterium]NIT85024.1 HDOD domain-containing protein [Nitrospinaceae bacterium]NIW08746.1 HDOD domain-containing protein [Nitrospinaceae bacterium]NIX37337.1 HDOD domain-containing protein [Nitrospinaceae bacterium]